MALEAARISLAGRRDLDTLTEGSIAVDLAVQPPLSKNRIRSVSRRGCAV